MPQAQGVAHDALRHLGKSVVEVHEKLEGEDGHSTAGGKVASFKAAIVQILILDVVFSLDSVITAVGMANELWIMITAVVVALGVMLAFAGAISDFVNRHPTLKMLAFLSRCVWSRVTWVRLMPRPPGRTARRRWN